MSRRLFIAETRGQNLAQQQLLEQRCRFIRMLEDATERLAGVPAVAGGSAQRSFGLEASFITSARRACLFLILSFGNFTQSRKVAKGEQ